MNNTSDVKVFSSGPDRVKATDQIVRQVIDPDGDLTLRVGRERGGCATTDFVVYAHDLGRASPVFKKLLFGGFSESKPAAAAAGKSGSSNSNSDSPGTNGGRSKEWVVELPDDDPEALRVLLNVIHARFDKLPTTKDSPVIDIWYRITVLTDKYALTHLLRPWAKQWSDGAWGQFKDTLDACASTGLKMDDITKIQKVSWIAWELGDLSLFQGAASVLALWSDGTDNRPLFTQTLEPPNAKESIMRIRRNMIVYLLGPYETTFNDLIRMGESKDDGFCRAGYECLGSDASCQQQALGMLVQQLYRQKLWPIPQPSKLDQSVENLSKHLVSIVCQCSHRSIEFEKKSQGTAVLVRRAMFEAADSAQQKHMRDRSAATGIEERTDKAMFMALNRLKLSSK